MSLKTQARRNFMGAVTTGVAASAMMGPPDSKGATPPETHKPGSAWVECGGGPRQTSCIVSGTLPATSNREASST